jgi:hypothetical protein
MTNEEVFERAHDEFVLRGMSPQTEESYLCALRLFLRYHDDRPIEAMGEPEIREFLLYQISIGKETGSVNIYNSALRFILIILMLFQNCIHQRIVTIHHIIFDGVGADFLEMPFGTFYFKAFDFSQLHSR